MPDMTQNEPGRGAAGMGSQTDADRTRGAASEIKGAAHDVANEARGAAASVRKEAAGLGNTIRQGLSQQAEQRKNRIADRLSAVADRAQRTADDLGDDEAWLGELVARGAHELQDVADEVRRQDFPGLLSSVEVFARRQPALFMGASVALGFAMTRLATARSPGPEGRRREGGGSYDAPGYGSRAGTYDRPTSSGAQTDTGAQNTPGAQTSSGAHTTPGTSAPFGTPVAPTTSASSSRSGEAPFVSGSNI